MRGLVGAALLLVGCYHPSVAAEVPCAIGSACPAGQTCDTSREPPLCVGPNTPDADVDAALLDLCGDTSGLQAGAPWPVEYGCPTNSGRSSALGPATSTTEVAPLGALHARRGAVVAAGNLIVVQDTSAGVIAEFDASGAAGWTYTGTSGAGVEPFPVIDDQNLVYATTDYGKLFVIDLATGAEAWTLQLSGAFSAPVIAAPGTIYYGSRSPYGFYAVDSNAHTQKWHFDVPNSGDASTAPAIGGGLVYFADTVNSELFALDAQTGAQLFAVPVTGTAVGSAVLGADTVYVATKTDGIAAFDAQTGDVKWQQPAGASVVQPALVATGDVVSSTTDGNAFVLDRTTGDQLYAMTIGANVLAPPRIDAADAIYFATNQGTFAYDRTGTFRWSSLLSGPIVLGDQELVVLPSASTIAVIGP